MKNTMQRIWSGMRNASLVAVCGTAVIAGTSVPTMAAPSGAVVRVAEELDQIIFRDGRIIKGVVDKETDDSVSIFVVVGTIRSSVASVYQKSDILSVVRGTGEKTEAGPGKSEDKTEVADPQPRESANSNKKIVYKITKGTPLNHHLGTVTFAPTESGTHMEWNIEIGAAFPGLDFIISKVLIRNIGGGLDRMSIPA